VTLVPARRSTPSASVTRARPDQRPPLLVHADWSVDPRKCWMATAEWSGRAYRLDAPAPVGDAATLVARMRARAGEAGLLLGFDFPIGLPRAFAQRAGLGDFRTALRAFGHGRWADVYRIASTPHEIALERPFYPARPGGASQAQLVAALDVDTFGDLRRACEAATGDRRAACPLFWTLGGNQVGRAAISGWQSLVAPALQRGAAVWPFDGPLAALLAEGRCVIAETYPAHACVHLGLPAPGRGWSKRRRADRARHAPALRAWARSRPVVITPALDRALAGGFGPAASGEDPFDAVVGLCAMVDVALGRAPDGCPDDRDVRTVEGWILGVTRTAGAAPPRVAARRPPC
jgi:hypothetical protein